MRERLASALDYFSIDLLLQTFFAPFRQISAGQVSGPIGVQWRAFVDRLISRCIGAVVRFFVIIIGIVSIIFFSVVGGLSLLLWPIVPLFPLIGLLLTFIGWTPSWM